MENGWHPFSIFCGTIHFSPTVCPCFFWHPLQYIQQNFPMLFYAETIGLNPINPYFNRFLLRLYACFRKQLRILLQKKPKKLFALFFAHILAL